MSYIFKIATLEDKEELEALINSCYRGESSRAGWTTEADILDGARVDRAMLENLLKNRDVCLLTLCKGYEIVASICLTKEEEKVKLGLIVVKASMQGMGIGKKIIEYAQEYAKREWSVISAEVEVISIRNELKEYYKRRGFVDTKKYTTLPNSSLWTSKVGEIKLLLMQKELC
ncbi:GNAT family N-acetyltransferase [Sulfurimonas crateris]|uniref:GNAT family N-acetyltransferase n=1 Tax=Sulfurimonas crateris TaxID=2574727 RepID=A0A4V5TM98_9BACT|nr:GNAT family N-acetyltransferase [Sulfurimonas crateris]TKI71063.1 GNAT family N-acetyltransferase [Sulfurimonas crateris]